jgi:RimJ/RimL family protein N-acetyltransferase
MNDILYTDRLILREYTLDDAPFMLRLVNEPSWLRYIGDRNVHSIEDAENYLTNGPIQSYLQYGFGFCIVLLKSSCTPIGVCGFARRPFLDDPDFGYAFLPEYTGQGYAFEITAATMEYGREILGLRKIVAYTTKDNQRSIHLLQKLGFRYERPIDVDGNELSLYVNETVWYDQEEIDLVASLFYQAFSNLNDIQPDLSELSHICIPEALIIKNVKGMTEVYSLSDFMASRKIMLSDGTLRDFSESELESRTDIYDRIAQRWSRYEKSGKYRGKPFHTQGTKSIQLIKTLLGWKINAVIWDDELLMSLIEILE